MGIGLDDQQPAEVLRDRLGLRPGAEETWLSGVDLGLVPAADVKGYTDAHRALVEAARQSSPTDIFWASYPFAVLVVEGRAGANFGQLQAVLLSPLHPARFAWAYAATCIAQTSTADAGLLARVAVSRSIVAQIGGRQQWQSTPHAPERTAF